MTRVYKYYTLVKSLYTQPVCQVARGPYATKSDLIPPLGAVCVWGYHKNIFHFFNKEFLNEAKNKR
tara:strand:- start:494 stop:691 length:198 start_codon:yes stop_codon:yes gene_type:complete